MLLCEPDSLPSSSESLCCVWSQLYYFLPVERCAVWRARLSPCLLTEPLRCQREPDSATFLAESLSCVWSESGPSTNTEPPGCTVLKCTLYILERSPWSCGEESRVPAAEPAGIVYIYSDIVQRSASEQTHMSHCNWYSKQM